MASLITELSEEQEKEVKSAFDIHDVDKDGKISTLELANVFSEKGHEIPSFKLREMVAKVDQNRSGKVEFPEFKKMWINQMNNEIRKKELREAFEEFDPDKTGFITKSEMKTAMSRTNPTMTVEEIEKSIKNADVDEDGKINYGEFLSTTNYIRLEQWI